MTRSARTAILAVVAAALLPLAPAWAHGDEEHGELTLSIGFGAEPAYVDQPNSVQVIVTHGDEPVIDLGGSLEVEVSFGDASTTLPLEPYFEVGEWGTPGDYRAWFVPSEPGAYTFAFAGEIEGEEVDLSMTSGPDTFSEVVDPAEAAFPPAATGPSNDELAQRIEQESTRTADAVRTAQAAVTSAEDAASSTRGLGIVGVVLGAAGLLVAIAALLSARRPAPAPKA
jgi:hypothetical protein